MLSDIRTMIHEQEDIMAEKNTEKQRAAEQQLAEIAKLSDEELFKRLDTDEDGLNQALKRLEELPESGNPTDEMRRMLAKAMLLSARERRESRGAHNRTDHPQRNDEHFRKTSVVTLQNGKIGLHYQAVGKDETND